MRGSPYAVVGLIQAVMRLAVFWMDQAGLGLVAHDSTSKRDRAGGE